MLKKLAFLVVLANLCANFALAEGEEMAQGNTFAPATPREEAENPQDSMDLRIKKFMLDIPDNKDIAKDAIKRDKETQEILDRFDEATINSQPEIRPMSSQDSVMVHPYFTTTFLLPTGAEISFVDSSIPAEVLKFDQNTLMFRPKKDFEIANLSVLYSIEKQNYVMNLILSRYERSKDNALNLVISYVNKPKREPHEVIYEFFRQYGKYPTDEFSYIHIDDILYRIVLDDDRGYIHINGRKYRVDNQKIYK